MKTIIVGLGNPILGDDGVGWKVAKEICRQLALPPTRLLKVDGSQVDVVCLSLGGIGLMEHFIGYDRVILIDAFGSDEELGSINMMKLKDMPNYSAFHISSTHDTSLQHAIELGRSLGAHLPEDIVVVGVVTQRICDFSETLSPPVAEALPQVVKIVLDLLK